MQTPKNEINHKKKNISEASFFEIDRFIPRLFRNWIIYVVCLAIAIFIAFYANNWYFSRVYSATTTFNVSANSSSGNPNLSNNSINFIWGGSSNKVDVLTRILASRSHSIEVAKATDSYVFYLEEGTLQKSNS